MNHLVLLLYRESAAANRLLQSFYSPFSAALFTTDSENNHLGWTATESLTVYLAISAPLFITLLNCSSDHVACHTLLLSFLTSEDSYWNIDCVAGNLASDNRQPNVGQWNCSIGPAEPFISWRTEQLWGLDLFTSPINNTEHKNGGLSVLE